MKNLGVDPSSWLLDDEVEEDLVQHGTVTYKGSNPGIGGGDARNDDDEARRNTPSTVNEENEPEATDQKAEDPDTAAKDDKTTTANASSLYERYSQSNKGPEKRSDVSMLSFEEIWNSVDDDTFHHRNTFSAKKAPVSKWGTNEGAHNQIGHDIDDRYDEDSFVRDPDFESERVVL